MAKHHRRQFQALSLPSFGKHACVIRSTTELFCTAFFMGFEGSSVGCEAIASLSIASSTVCRQKLVLICIRWWVERATHGREFG